MFSEDVCLGTSCGLDKIRNLSDVINSKVIDEINGNQELVMLTNFAVESNEYQFKKILEERISDVTSWRWVLEDLSKRLEDAVEALKYEHNVLRVVVQRVKDELNYNSREALRPGAICPLSDVVEDTIMQEFEFLRDQKKNFEKLIVELDKQTTMIEKTKKNITDDILDKIQALSIDEMCANKSYKDEINTNLKKRRRRGYPVARWIKRCSALKRAGLKALCNAITTRQQVRGARIQLSIAAQAYGAKIDTVLRRRLHTNKVKMHDLKWQRDEAVRDYTLLGEELTLTEKTLIESLDQDAVIEARLSERSRRPNRELIKDDVNRKLRDEQTQLRKFRKELRNNVDRIISLQNDLGAVIAHIDCCAEDLAQVIQLDEERIRTRQGEQIDNDSCTTTPSTPKPTREQPRQEAGLTVIREEDEDDYPFDF